MRPVIPLTGRFDFRQVIREKGGGFANLATLGGRVQT
jgi:hypothetical protein